MDKNIINYIDNELSHNVREALNETAQAIYFNDNSDYLSALWQVVIHLMPTCEVDEDFIKELVCYLNPDYN